MACISSEAIGFKTVLIYKILPGLTSLLVEVCHNYLLDRGIPVNRKWINTSV
jgi:hypothetical protein